MSSFWVGRLMTGIGVFLGLAFLIIFFTACRQKVNPPSETGLASFYSPVFEGRKTSSGALFSNSKLTAAHRTLPFGTHVRVTNLKNNKSVVVTITDRGPFVEDRIIDLSQAAAIELDFMEDGVVSVRLEVLLDD